MSLFEVPDRNKTFLEFVDGKRPLLSPSSLVMPDRVLGDDVEKNHII